MSIQASQERDSSCLTDRKREVLAEGRLPQHLTAMEMLSGPVHVLLPAAELPARPCSLRAGFTQAPSLLPLRWVPTGSLLSRCLASPCTAARSPQSAEQKQQHTHLCFQGPLSAHLLFHFQGLYSGHKVAGHVAFSSCDERLGQPPVSSSKGRRENRNGVVTRTSLFLGQLTALHSAASSPRGRAFTEADGLGSG